MFGDSFSDEAPPKDSSEALFSKKVDGSESYAHKRREHAGNFVRLYMQMNGREPNDVEIKNYLECQVKSNVMS